jgi:hypothetical protein
VGVIVEHRGQVNELRSKTRSITEALENPGGAAAVGGGHDMGADAAAEAHKWAELKRSMSKGAADTEARFKELQQAAAEGDGFACIAKFFGEGMIQ